jgi:flagella basal body P-ring formation protein FlgA
MTPIFRRLTLLAAAIAAPAQAQTFENLAMLDSRISAALGAGIGEPGGAVTPLDRRLRLAACPQPAEIGEPAAGALAVRCAVQGWRIRVPLVRNASSGTTAAASPSAVRAEPIVRRGDQVELVAIGASFAVSTLAIAEQDGAPGDRIRLRTERRTTPIFGQVLADGRVALPGFN